MQSWQQFKGLASRSFAGAFYEMVSGTSISYHGNLRYPPKATPPKGLISWGGVALGGGTLDSHEESN